MGSFKDHAIQLMGDAINRYDSGELKSEQTRNAAICIVAITLDCAREEEHGTLKTMKGEEAECAEALRQIRNAFAHGPTEPKWKIDDPNKRREYNIGTETNFDLSKKDGTDVDIVGDEIVKLLHYLNAKLFS